jgi:hypothetical protein
MAQTQLLTGISEPLSGEDAERLVTYIEKPVLPEGHDQYLAEADKTYVSIRPKPATA